MTEEGKLTNGGKKAEAISLALEKFKEEGANVLLPSTRIEGLSEWHEPVIDQVRLEPDPKQGDVYCQDSNAARYAITRQGLLKLSACAGVIWHTGETHRVDDGKDRNYVCFKATGGVRKADGTPFFYQASYDLDFEIVQDEIEEGYIGKRAAYDKKVRNKDKNYNWWAKMDPTEKDSYIDKCIRRDLLQKRKHKLKLAESGAMNRVIRALLSLKATYSQVELKQPFVIARIIIKPDFNDKEVRRQLMTAAIQSMTGIYGGREAIPEAITLPHEEIIELGPQDEPIILDEDEHDREQKRGKEAITKDLEDAGLPVIQDGDQEGEEEKEEGGEEEYNQRNSLELDFRDSNDEAQVKLLMILAKQKDYDLKTIAKPISSFSQEHRMMFWNKLMDIPVPDNDIPF